MHHVSNKLEVLGNKTIKVPISLALILMRETEKEIVKVKKTSDGNKCSEMRNGWWVLFRVGV